MLWGVVFEVGELDWLVVFEVVLLCRIVLVNLDFVFYGVVVCDVFEVVGYWVGL